MSPLVSIVIPTYNRAADLERALMSVVEQSFCDWEAVVVDNYSTDDTEKIIASFGDPRISIHKIHNHGVIAKSRNFGIQLAKGKYVAFLDSDDWWLSSKLAESVACLDSGADVVYHDLFLVRRLGRINHREKARTRALMEPVESDLITNGNALTNSSVVVVRQLLLDIGGFSEESDLVAIEDYDGWIRLSQLTNRFFRIPKTLGYYWAGGGNTNSMERVLNTVNVFEKRYASKIQSLSVVSRYFWFVYARGRASYAVGLYRQAVPALWQAVLHARSIAQKLKSLYMLINASARLLFCSNHGRCV